MKHFPQPHKIGGATRWSPNEIRAFEAATGLDLPAPTGMLSDTQLAARYGVSRATIWRWASKARKEAAA
ncbi:MAG: hypothetical protein CMN57_11430 [Gammaproteobacteria bacterium]|nr:hypothetical protein [Gammaproteobacteria bacterium]